MKAASAPLLALLATGDYVSADCWTITLNGGTVIRWTSADKPISFGGIVWAEGPMIVRGPISEKTGPDVATLQVTITGLATDLINGVPVIPFIAAHGLDGAVIKLERAFAPDWNSAIVGTLIRFAGKVTSVDQIQGASAQITVSSWMVLLQFNMPRNIYQAACRNTLYDAGCSLSPASFSRTGTIPSGGAGQTVTFATSLGSITANDYAMGRIVFTSGANNGISRNIKSNDASANITVFPPLPHALATSDGFTIFKGCDLTQSTCSSKFNNLPNFRAEPYTPLPRTVVGSATSTTTSRGGK